MIFRYAFSAVVAVLATYEIFRWPWIWVEGWWFWVRILARIGLVCVGFSVAFVLFILVVDRVKDMPERFARAVRRNLQPLYFVWIGAEHRALEAVMYRTDTFRPLRYRWYALWYLPAAIYDHARTKPQPRTPLVRLTNNGDPPKAAS